MFDSALQYTIQINAEMEVNLMSPYSVGHDLSYYDGLKKISNRSRRKCRLGRNACGVQHIAKIFAESFREKMQGRTRAPTRVPQAPPTTYVYEQL